EGVPRGLDAALLEEFLRLQDGADHLLARPDDDPPGVDGPPALALEPLLGLARDLLVGQGPAPLREAPRCRGRGLRAPGAGRGEIGGEEPAGRLGREREELPAPETARRRS